VPTTDRATSVEVRRILRRLNELRVALDAHDPQFDRRAGVAATALLMAGEELDMAGVSMPGAMHDPVPARATPSGSLTLDMGRARSLTMREALGQFLENRYRAGAQMPVSQ